jgi:dolichol-phosphate mannosyltransferase
VLQKTPSPIAKRQVTRGVELSVIIPCYNERPNVAPLFEKLDVALNGVHWEVIFVDDNSPDGTADAVRHLATVDSRARCMRRIGRRGLASAVIEGILSSSARYVAVMDGDLQHDDTRLPEMLRLVREDQADIVVASRFLKDGDATGLANAWRHSLSGLGIRMARAMLPVRLTDPMSGFFMLRRDLFEQLAPQLTGQGFKILLDLMLTAGASLRITEIPVRFQKRLDGESKLDIQVLLQFAGLLLDKALGGILPLRFISFALVGSSGVLVHLVALFASRAQGIGFDLSQGIATLTAIVWNFQLNNSITYRDQRLQGHAFWRGLASFVAVCSVGALANIGIAHALHNTNASWTAAGAMGAAIGVVWNFAVSATLVWRAH